MKILLTHSPLDDPTIPYHSNAYLAGHLAHSGFEDVSLRDTNVEFFNWCLGEGPFASFQEEAARRFHALESKSELDFEEQEQYLALWFDPQLEYGDLQQAKRTLRSRESFFDFPTYKKSVKVIQDYFGILAALSYPSDLGNFRQASRGRYSQCHLRDLFDDDLGRQICRPFLSYLDEKIVDDPDYAAADTIGVSIVYEHQMFHAIQFARWLKRRWPDKQVVFGGTSISQLYKYLRDKDDMGRFFSFVDGIVAGEGETAICQIADAGEITPGMPVQNLITYDASRDKVHLPERVHYESVPALGRPLFLHDWDQYLSPERGINYSPTRGCYWNKCTFCDYGLNTSTPTSPWRERRIDQVVDDLTHAVDDSGVRFAYFAVDVMSPAYMGRLADALVDAGLGLRWGAEIRMEKVFSPELCRKIQSSGCVHVSFGMESGNQRILDLIDKGTRVEYMGETMKNFAEAGVAVHLFTFVGFPTETPEEEEETKEFIRQNEAYWSGGGMGGFLLTGTAIVAKDPDRFGVRLVDVKDADVARALAYELEDEEKEEERRSRKDRELDEMEADAALTAVSSEEADGSFDDDGGVFPGILGRPWAGSTDCLHTMIYYEVYDRTFFRIHAVEVDEWAGPEDDRDLLRCTFEVPGLVRESSFDMGRMIDERRELAGMLVGLSRVPEEPTLEKFRAWASGRPTIQRNEAEPTYWIRSGERVLKLDKLVYKLLTVGAASGLPLGELLEFYPEELRPRLIRFLRHLASSALINFKDPKSIEVRPMPQRRVPLPERNPSATYRPPAPTLPSLPVVP